MAMKRTCLIFQGNSFKNVVMSALLLDLKVDFNIFLPMILIVKSMFPNKLSFWPLKNPICYQWHWFSFQGPILRLLLATKWVFKEIIVFLTLKQKRVLLVDLLFDLKVDFGVFYTQKNGCIFNYCAGIGSTHVTVMSVSNANTITCVYPLAPISYEMEECYIHNVLIT